MLIDGTFWALGIITMWLRDNGTDWRSTELPDYVTGVIESVVLERSTQLRSKLYELACRLKTVPEFVRRLDSLSPEQKLSCFKAVTDYWCDLEHVAEDREVCLAALLEAYRSAKFPWGGVKWLIENIDRYEVPHWARGMEKPYQRLAILVREMQRCVGDRPFGLGAYDAATVIGKEGDFEAGYAALTILRHLGVLERVAKGRWGKVARYRYLPEREK